MSDIIFLLIKRESKLIYIIMELRESFTPLQSKYYSFQRIYYSQEIIILQINHKSKFL